LNSNSSEEFVDMTKIAPASEIEEICSKEFLNGKTAADREQL